MVHILFHPHFPSVSEGVERTYYLPSLPTRKNGRMDNGGIVKIRTHNLLMTQQMLFCCTILEWLLQLVTLYWNHKVSAEKIVEIPGNILTHYSSFAGIPSSKIRALRTRRWSKVTYIVPQPPISAGSKSNSYYCFSLIRRSTGGHRGPAGLNRSQCLSLIVSVKVTSCSTCPSFIYLLACLASFFNFLCIICTIMHANLGLYRFYSCR